VVVCVGDTDGENEELAQPVPEREVDTDPDTVGVTDDEWLREGDAVCVGGDEGLRVDEPHVEGEPLTLGDLDDEAHAVAVVESVMERVGVGVAVDVRHNDGEPELEGEAEGQCDTVAVTEAQREAEGEPELLTVSVGVMEGVYVRLPVGLAEAEREAEGHADDDREPEAQPLPVGEIVEVRHSEGVPD
jgi:hypothetical protein